MVDRRSSSEAPSEAVPAALIERARRGDEEARDALMRAHQDLWFRFCLAQLRDPDAARDATQETALRVLRGLSRFRGESRFATWSLGVAVNVCREAQRGSRRWLPFFGGRGAAQHESEPAASPASAEALDRTRLAQWLDGLAPRQREAISLRYLEELSVAETARSMRCSEGTVKATVSQALALLRARHGEEA